MLWHSFKYRVKINLKSKQEIMWTLLFPIVLATFFYASFSSIMEKSEMFKEIKIAYVSGDESEGENAFYTFIKQLSEGEDAMLEIVETDKEEAESLLQGEKIEGIIYYKDDVWLNVKKDGINQSILKSILDQYIQKTNTIETIMRTDPAKLETAIDSMENNIRYIESDKFTESKMDNLVNYFYSLIAMGCLFSSFIGVKAAVHMKANMSTIAMRRNISNSSKLVMIIADFAALLLVQFICSVISFIYIVGILKVEFGDKYLFMLLIMLMGNIIGISTGILIGSIRNISEGVKNGIAVSVSLMESFLSGLMIGNIKNTIEHTVPIINRINPASLLVDAFYSLDMCNDYNRYIINIVSLLIISIVMCVVSYLLVRREQYASL